MTFITSSNLLNPVFAEQLKSAVLRDHHHLSVVQFTHDYAAHETCGDYHYAILEGSYSHCAFKKKEHFLNWLNERGLSLNGELEDEDSVKQGRVIGIRGHYISAMLSVISIDETTSQPKPISDFERLYNADGARHTRVLHNANYTAGVVLTDDDGAGIICYVHCGVYGQKYMEFDYQESKALFG